MQTRRSVLRTALICSAGFATGAYGQKSQGDRSRIAVATYPFRASIIAPGNHDRDTSKPGMDLAAFAKTIRTQFGVRGIEPLHSHFAATETPAILQLRAAFDQAGIYTANIPVDQPVELCSPDAAKRSAGNASYRRWIDIAVLLGSPSIRIWLPKCNDAPGVTMALDALRPTLKYAASQNIIVNLENDDPVMSSDTRIIKAIRQANIPNLKALPDFANSLMGGDDRFNAQAVKNMFAHAGNITHVKDAEMIQGMRRSVSLAELFGFAKAAGFRGTYSMESDSNVDPFTDTMHLIQQTLLLM